MKETIVKNYITGIIAVLIPVDDNTRLSKKELISIVTIFNQPEVGKVLTRNSDSGKFGINNAKSLIENYRKGYVNKTNYLYLLKKDGNIIAGADLQVSNKNKVTTGFWQDVNESGYMTNTIRKLIDITRKKGFKTLYSYVELDNKKAMALLKRVGFSYKGIVKGKTKKRLREYKLVIHRS
ncbi:GNAT family N-acetyltransferase [Patescibacteria group bacterium]